MSEAVMSMMTPWQPVSTMLGPGPPAAGWRSRPRMSIWMETRRMSPILRIGTRFHQPARASWRLTRRPRTRAAPAAARRPGWPWWRCRRTRCPARRSVCAICGRMPEMMHSAPISRAATTVLRMCWATWVSTAGTPVMSMIAYGGAGVDQGLQQPLHHDLGAGRVQRADQRDGDDAVPQLDDRGGELQQLLGLVGDHALARGGVGLEGEQPEVVDPTGQCREAAVAVGVVRLLEDGEHRLLEAEDADGGLGGGEALAGAGAADLAEQTSEVGVAVCGDAVVVRRGALGGEDAAEDVTAVALELRARHAPRQCGGGDVDPAGQDRVAVALKDPHPGRVGRGGGHRAPSSVDAQNGPILPRQPRAGGECAISVCDLGRSGTEDPTSRTGTSLLSALPVAAPGGSVETWPGTGSTPTSR